MKYDDRYTRVNDKWENGGMFRGKELCECGVCNEPTPWVEPTFSAHICSDECYSSMCKEYAELTRMGARIIMD